MKKWIICAILFSVRSFSPLLWWVQYNQQAVSTSVLGWPVVPLHAIHFVKIVNSVLSYLWIRVFVKWVSQEQFSYLVPPVDYYFTISSLGYSQIKSGLDLVYFHTCQWCPIWVLEFMLQPACHYFLLIYHNLPCL